MSKEEKELLVKMSIELTKLREEFNKFKKDYSGGGILLDSSPECVREYVDKLNKKEVGV